MKTNYLNIELTEKETELLQTMSRTQGQIDLFLMSIDEKKTAKKLLKKELIEKGTAIYDGRFKVYSLTCYGWKAI